MNRILDKRIIPLSTIDNIDDALPVAEALIEGGLPIIEIPFRTSIAAEAIKKLRDNLPVQQVLRGLSHDGVLTEIRLGPLTEA